jgi:peroxiredoxin
MTKLHTGVSAPLFRQKDVFGRDIDLNNYREKRVLIAFFRHAGCPFCNLRVHFLTKMYEKLRTRDFEMIFFFESKEQVILRSTFHQEVSPVPIISDPEKKWYQAYGLEGSAFKSTISHFTSFVQTAILAKQKGVPIHLMASGESFNTLPAEFLLERGLQIKKLHYSQSLTDRMDMQEIELFAETGRTLD